MKILEDRWYTDQHEWALVVSETGIRVGITDYAQDALGDVVYVELPAIGATFARGDTMAEVESTKSVADVYAPASGVVRAVNDALAERPELVNADPFGDGWFLELDTGGTFDASSLLDAAGYRELTEPA